VNVAQIDQDAIESMRFISNRIEKSSEFARSAAREEVVNAAFKLYVDSRHLHDMWWEEIARKYQFNYRAKEYSIDFEKNYIYYKENK
jgi:hypothetical protein